MKRVGLFGGSFNPAHQGHLQLSLAAMSALALDELWWLVSPGNPLKDGQDMAPYEARFASAEALAAGAPIIVSDFERRAGTRFTVDTLRALLKEHPGDSFIWLMGADAFAQFHRWKDWQSIAQMLPIAVLPRPGYDAAARAASATGWLSAFVRPESHATDWTEWSPPAIVHLRLPTNPTSSTSLRAQDPDWHCRSHGPGSGPGPGDDSAPT